MYLRQCRIENIGDPCRHTWDFSDECGAIRGWSMLDGGGQGENTLVLKLIGICLGAGTHFPRLAEEILALREGRERSGYFGVILQPDPPGYGKTRKRKEIRIGYEILPGGEIRPSPARDAHPPGTRALTKGFNDLMSPLGYFAYGYNAQREYAVYEDLDPAQVPRLRSSRFGSLFDNDFPLTHPTDWLLRQYRNATRHNSKKAERLYNVSLSLIAGVLHNIKSFHWDEKDILLVDGPSGSFPITSLPRRTLLLIAFLIDLVRQMADSKRTIEDFNLCEGILCIDHFERLFCSPEECESWITAVSGLFPNMQFIASCYDQGISSRVGSLRYETVPSPSARPDVFRWISVPPSRSKFIRQKRNIFLKIRFTKGGRASKESVVLIDVDSTIPNLALMKLSRYYKNRGRDVILARDSAQQCDSRSVFASCIFRQSNTDAKIEQLKRMHGEHIRIGGSGIDLSLRLPDEIESLMPDYDLYPGMDYGMGFLTRGCPHDCQFCVVPVKEGPLRMAARIDDILPPGRKKLVLLDDNLLAYPEVNAILREMIDKNLQVNFNQTLDIRYLDPENARLLQMTDSRNYTFTKRMYYFGMNSSGLIPVVEEKIRLLNRLRRSEIMFICMYGYNTTLSDDIKRFSFLQRLGVSPFVQEFQPISGMPVPVVENYFDIEIDPLLTIYFRQNGRNFERFLKWVSRRYAEAFGELHMPLVDLIFKYNNKQYKHRYIATLAGTRAVREIL